MSEIEQLARLIDRSGLSRRQFAMRVMGRSETTLEQYFRNRRIPNDSVRRWIRSVETVELRGGRLVVTMRVFAPTRREAQKSR